MNRHRIMPSTVFVIFSLILALGAWGAVEAVGYPFADDFESDLGNWTAEAPWGLTTAYYASPVSSVTDSPSTFYAASVDASLTLGSSVDLSSATRPVLRFYHRYQIEDGYDFGYVEVSTDDGTTWSAPVATYTGATATWLREQIDLSAYAGYADVRIRFRMVSDDTVVQDGWYIDDVLIAEGPAAINLDTPVTVTTNSVDLTWDESLEADFAAYRIYRSNESAFDWRDATLVAEIDESSTLSHTDITVTPKSTFHYQVMVLTTSDLHSVSNEVSATTDVGMDYPFLDDGEGTGTAWSADPPWALTTENANSGTHSWSDSPGGDYGDGIASQALTLVSPIDLMGETSPVLSFLHHWTFAAGDSGNVEISTDDGASWIPLGVFTNGNSDSWVRERYDVSAYTSSSEVLVRFRITTGSSLGADGWYVDDISVAESPTEVDPPILDQVTSHSMRLTWARCNDLLFSHYAIHRSTTSDVGIKSELVAEISNQDTTTFTDSGLAVDTDYYYRVYAVSPYGTYSPDSTSESTERTGGNPYPFSDNFEGSLENWNLTGKWQKTDADKYEGDYSLTDSPGTTYDPSDTSEARTTIDLTTSIRPVLRFWDRGGFADIYDWGYLEVSTDGSNWSRIYSLTGIHPDWSEQSLDLSRWKTSTNLRIRFVVTANGSGVNDGWYIDDLSIDEHPVGSVAIPFFEDFEAGTGNWLTSAWAPSSDTPHAGAQSARSSTSGIKNYSELAMELASPLDLTETKDPQLVFWFRGTTGNNGSFRAQVSTNDGASWGDLAGASVGENQNLGWTRFQTSLEDYRQSDLRLRFLVTQSTYDNPGQSVFVDDVSIEEMPEAVFLDTLTPHLKSVDLSWEQTTLGADFDRYEVYRATHATVTTADTLIATLDTSTETTFTDTGLSIGATYYYKVFVYNTRAAAVPSNERYTTTVPLGLPFEDSMENLDNWDATGTWGPDGNTPFEGSFSIADSPGDNYPATTSNEQILTAVNLTTAIRPVLRFWDRGTFADTGDWGYLEVSTDGSNWSRIYSLTGSKPAWSEQSLDLSPWKTATNLRIRFVVTSNGSGGDDGWYIDDLSIDEQPVGSVAIPFFEDFEAGTGSWLTSAWAPSADTPHAGAQSARSSTSGIKNYTELAMELASPLDLTGTTDPQLIFWFRGVTGNNGGFRVQVSTNGGVGWINLPPGVGENQNLDWTRFQTSLADYRQSDLRLRFLVTQSSYDNPGQSVFVDDISIEELPDNVELGILTPHLKSIDLSWSETTLGVDFDRYEVYRATEATVTTADTLIATSDTSTDTTFTDTGLSIGATYYYRVFVYNTRAAAVPSNERYTTTVPLGLPFEDSMENLDNWDATGTWGPDGNTPFEGSFSIADSPGDNYPATTSNEQILTAVNLTTAIRPVLRFWDRGTFADTGDWGYLEVSTDGANWSKIYSLTGSKPAWSEQSLDLSQWKTATNLRIRFVVTSNGSGANDGWYIDDLSIDEQPVGSVAIPFFEDFEAGTGNWLTSAWAPSADTPHAGAQSARSSTSGIKNYTELAMELASPLDLTGTTDPQLVFWFRGITGNNGGFRVQVSTNGGVGWINLPPGVGENQNLDWTRFQTSLADYRQSDLRLRFLVTQSSYDNPGQSVFVDDISIEELPVAVALSTPDQVTISSMRLQWNDRNDPAFAAYALYRSETSTVDTNSELIGWFEDQATTAFVDTGLQARKTYYYRIYFVDTTNTYSPSNSTSAMTLGVAMPFEDDFETDSGVWTVTGEWGPVVAAGIGESTSFGDTPGDLTPNVDTWAVTGVDLSGTDWPVLAFTDRFDFGGHWGRVEISSNGGATWTVLYGATQSQTEWVQRRFDLSPWGGLPQVWIRFFVDANGGVPADGWHIDDLYIGENPIAGSSGYPFFDGFEDGPGDWLAGPWMVTGDDPYEGSSSILDTVESRIANSELWLTYGSELDLSAASDPLLTFQVRGNTPNNNYFRGQVSTDEGRNWQDLGEIYIHDNQSLPDWTRMQTSLSDYQVSNLRVRFRVYGNYGGDSNIYLDNIAVGEQTPAAPTLNAPAMGNSEDTVRPTLTVDNAVDFQSDPMTYHFQVFDDSGLTNIVAEVPAVAGGIGTTSWTVNPDLLPDTQYWWRCRATDDTGHTGPWMETATFFVQLADHPPTAPVIIGPSLGGQLPDLNGRLAWLESSDPDEDNGDYVAGYRVQVDDDPSFASAEIDVPGITITTKAIGAMTVSLGELEGSGNLVLGTRYYWRVNATDSHGGASEWSAGPMHFVFGSDETAPTCVITSPADDATVTDTPITITGTATDELSGVAIVEVSTDGGTTWVQAVGADSWSHQWWPALSNDYSLTCRATDVAENEGAESSAITVHADLDRTMAFAQSSATIDEDAGTYSVTVSLSAARATEVTAELALSGSAQSASDFEALPEVIRFFPGQTALVFPITITDDDSPEGNETLTLELTNANLPDVTFGTNVSLTLTIVDNDEIVDPDIFSNGFEDGDFSGWSAHVP